MWMALQSTGKLSEGEQLSFEKYPAWANVAYKTGLIWPLDKGTRSRPGQSGCWDHAERRPKIERRKDIRHV